MKKYLILFLLIQAISISYSQVDTGLIKSTVFAIPESPAFVLLGTNPANVIKPGFTKDLKIDYILKEGKLVSDLAIDVKPFWMFAYNKYSLEEYRNLTYMARALGTLNISLGTAEKDKQKKFAWSATMILIRTDPVCDMVYDKEMNNLLDITSEDSDFRFAMMDKIARLEKRIDSLKNKPELVELKQELANQLKIYEDALENHTQANQQTKIKKLKAINTKYLNDHFGDPVLQIGFGQLYNYDNPSLDSLKFKNSGFGLWFQGSWGFDIFDAFVKNKNTKEHMVIISGMGRYTKIDGFNNQFYGLNLKYGDAKVNLFGEFCYEKAGTIESYIVTYGGELRIDETKSIMFGLKNRYTDNFSTTNLIPAIKINWILAGNSF